MFPSSLGLISCGGKTVTDITLTPGETPTAVFFYHNVNVTSIVSCLIATPECSTVSSVSFCNTEMLNYESHHYCDVKCRLWWSSAPLWHHRIESRCQNSPSCPQNWAVASITALLSPSECPAFSSQCCIMSSQCTFVPSQCPARRMPQCAFLMGQCSTVTT